jgi:integrase/recombinase XerD
MKQARTLNAQELKIVLATIAVRPHALRNRAMMLLTHWAGLRVGEVAALSIGDVIDHNKKVLSELKLSAEQAKRRHARTVFINQKLRKELQAYVDTVRIKDLQQPLFYTQKRAGFSANTLAQLFLTLYRRAGMRASSHSGRRSFITTLAAQGVSVRVLASLAGHRSITTTHSYIDVNDDMKRRAVEIIA